MNTQPTVLIVDDEPRALLFLRTLIEPQGYRVVSAARGAEAFAVALKERPDVALLDVMMPEMDGFELCLKMRAEPALSQMPILLLTALDDRASRLRGLEVGADDFLNKPVDSAELRIRLRTITRLDRFRQLYDERARFEAAVAFSPDGILLTETDGTMLLVNDTFKHLLVAPARPESNLFYHLSELVRQKLQTQIDGPGTTFAPFETSLIGGRDGNTVEITGGRIPWQSRTILQFNIRDITDKKSLEEQLLRSQRIELLGQMAGGIVHDVNNLFTTILGSASLMQSGDPQMTETHISNIIKSTQRGASLLRQLLMFARGADGALDPIYPGEVLGEVASVINETFGADFKISYVNEEGLFLIMADPTQLHQIVMNLCVNARDAMPDGGSITISSRREKLDEAAARALGPEAKAGDFFVASVRDSGTGIPPEIRAKLFDPFFTTKPKGKGTGLGLATVLRLVKRHNGFVILDTEVGKGTCFACYIPIVDPQSYT